MNTSIKDLQDIFRSVTISVRRCRAGYNALRELSSFNGHGDAMALTLRELETIADQLAKDARVFAKAVGEIATTVGRESTPTIKGTDDV